MLDHPIPDRLSDALERAVHAYAHRSDERGQPYVLHVLDTAEAVYAATGDVDAAITAAGLKAS